VFETTVTHENGRSAVTVTKTVGIIIATRNRADPLRRCLDSLCIQTRGAEAVVIVDSSDDDATERLAAEFDHRIAGMLWIRSSVRSAARQRNLGAERVDTDIVMFLDDDVVLEPEFIAAIMHVFEDTSIQSTAGVSGTITNQVYSDPKGLNRLLLGFCIGQWRGSFAGRLVGPAVNFLPEDRPVTVQAVEWIPAGCGAYDRRIFLSERFADFEGYSFAEDVHLSSRIARKHRLFNTTEARLYHEDLGQHTHKDWFAIGHSQVVNRHLILTAVLRRRGVTDMLRLFAFEMVYCPVAYLAAGASSERRRILGRLMAGKWNGFRTVWCLNR
jgi:glycosyltransferase involved in cell wall biosynthesis